MALCFKIGHLSLPVPLFVMSHASLALVLLPLSPKTLSSRHIGKRTYSLFVLW